MNGGVYEDGEVQNDFTTASHHRYLQNACVLPPGQEAVSMSICCPPCLERIINYNYYFYYNIEVESKCLDVNAIFDSFNNKKNLIKIIDILGRSSSISVNKPLFYIYDDGTVEKKIIIE